MMLADNSGFLTRSHLRDAILIVSGMCALFYRPSDTGVRIAFFLLVLGCFIRFLTKGVLIRNEVLCKEGIYSIVRHPYYLANFIIDCCFCLLSGTSVLVLVYPFLFFWSYGPSIRKEEQTLEERHPAAFRTHVLSTPMLFPDRSSIRNIGSLFAGFSRERVSSKEVARIVRFFAMAILIMVVGRVSFADFLKPGLFIREEAGIMLFVAVLLYAGSVVILSRRKDRTGEDVNTDSL